MKFFIAILFLFSSLLAIAQSCPVEDCTNGQTPQNSTPPAVAGSINAITAPTKAMAIIEADSFAPGPITPAEIKAKFPNSYFEGFSPKTRNGSGEYNSLLSGNAFAWNESDELVVIPEGASFKETDTVAIHLSNPCTEFGVNIADWTSPFLLFFYSYDSLIGSSEFFSDSAPFNYFSSDTPFGEVRLACSTQFGNWVIAEFAVEKAPEPELPIPTMGQWGLFLFSLITLSVSLGTVYAFRRKAATT